AQRAPLLAAGIPAGTGAVGLAIRKRAPVLTPDIAGDRRLVFPDAYRPLMREMPNRAALAVPLVANGHVPGGLVLYAPTGRRFTQAEARLAQTFADHAAVAFDKARLFAELEGLYGEARAHAQEATALADVARRLAGGGELARVEEE